MTTSCFVHDFNGNTAYLKAFAMKLTKDSHMAEDLFQDTAFLAFKNQDKFQMGTNLKAWLSTIMKNTFINQYRKRKRHGIVFDDSPENFLLNSGNQIEMNAGETNVTLEEIDVLVESLSKNLKKPFQMATEGFKYEEIAQTMDLPLGTVKSRIFMARKALQKQMKSLYKEIALVELAA